MKKTYYIEIGDGMNSFGAKEVVSDMRYSNALQSGGPIEDETHALLSALGIYDESLVTVRKADKDIDRGFHDDTTLAVMFVRVWCEEEEEEEEE